MAPLFESSFLEELLSSLNLISDAPPPNPFPHLVPSFSTPTTREVIIIKDAIANSSSHEDSIEKLLPRLRDVERTLQARLDAERDYKSQLRGMLSTIRLLPPEVLSNIFLLCSPDEIDHYSRATLNRSIPWSTSRVCRKWRYVCRSTPRLWVHIPTINLNHEYKSGFLELLRTAMDLSLPHDIGLQLRDTNAEKFERFENILPRVHFLDVEVDLPMIKGLVQRKERFKRLKSARIDFTSTPYEEPPILDCLAPVTSLDLSCSFFPWTGDGTPYGLLRSVDSHWPNLTTFHGDRLPANFLRRILFSAPLLRAVTMHDTNNASSDWSTVSPAPTCHVNLRHLSLTCPIYDSLPDDVLEHLHLPGLKSLHVEYGLSPKPFLSFLRDTHGSLVELSLKQSLARLDDQRAMYTLCPALKTFLSWVEPDDLGMLVVSSQSKLCPTLRHLTLHDFDVDSARALADICASRGLAPFSTPDCSSGSFQLDRITVYMELDNVSLFRQHCLGGNENYDNPPLDTGFLLLDTTSLDFSYQTLKEKLEDLKRTITTETPYFLILLEDRGIIEEVRDVADGKGNHRDDIREDARRAHEQWAMRVQEIRGKPWWKMIQSSPDSEVVGYVLERGPA